MFSESYVILFINTSQTTKWIDYKRLE